MVWHSAVFMTGSSLGEMRRRSKVVTTAPVAGSWSTRETYTPDLSSR